MNGWEKTVAPAARVKRTSRLGPILRVAAFKALAVIATTAVPSGLNVRGLRERILPRKPRATIHALAVLPLANLSGDREQEYLADGMTETLITELGKVSSPR